MEVVELTGFKRPLDISVLFCIQCGQVEAVLVDRENDLRFCSKKCQEAYHCYIIPETPWNQLKRQFYVTNHLLRPDMITKYLLLLLQCEGVNDIVAMIVSLMIGNSLSIYLSPERTNVYGNETYVIGGHGLCSHIDNGGRRRCIPLCDILGMTYDYLDQGLVLLIRGDDEEGGAAYKYNIDGVNNESGCITNTEDAVEITGSECKLLIRYGKGVVTMYGRGPNKYGIMGFGKDRDIPSIAQFYQIYGIERPMMVSTMYRNTVVIDMDGTLWVTGVNYTGQLGLPMEIRGVDRFIRINTPMSCIDAACTQTRIFFITVDGQLWESSLVKGGFVRSETPQGMSSSLCRIRTTHADIFVIDVMGYVWVKGDNSSGLHGIGHRNSHDDFVRIPGITDAVSISCIWHIAYIFTRSGTIYWAGQIIDSRDLKTIYSPYFSPLDYLPLLKPLHIEQHIESTQK